MEYFTWWTCCHQVSMILTIFMLLVWYCSILIHFESVLFDSVHIDFLSSLVFIQCSCFGMVIVPRVLACVVLFLLCVFSLFSQIQGVVLFAVDLWWFPILCLAFTDDHGVDWSSCCSIHRQCLHRRLHTPTS